MVEPMACVACGHDALPSQAGVRACSYCTLLMAADLTTMDYGAAYVSDASLYGAHLKMLDHFQTVSHGRLRLLPFEQRIVDSLDTRRGAGNTLVDIGCGTGRFLRAAELAGVSAGGFEVAPVLVERLRHHGRRVEVGGIEEFLASDLRPSVITMLEVVEHLPGPGALIRRLLSEKRPRRLHVVVPAWRTRRAFDRRFAAHDVPPNHLTWWNAEALTHLLGVAGYRVEVEPIAETRRSLLGHLARNPGPGPAASLGDWVRSVWSPPTFWWLATAVST